MDSTTSTHAHAAGHHSGPAHAVLAEVMCTAGAGDEWPTFGALILHAAPAMLVLEASDPRGALPPVGTEVRVVGQTHDSTGRLAEHGRDGRFLVSLGSRPVRRAARVRVCLPGTLRSVALSEAMAVEIVDLTTSGARVRGLELPVGTGVTLDFTPPTRDAPVMVKAVVAHGTQGATSPWIGVVFRLVALRGGR